MGAQFRQFVLLPFILTFVACASAPPRPAVSVVPQNPAYALRVALYPVPDVNNDQYASLIQRIESEFAASTGSQYTVDVVFGNSSDYYNEQTLQTWLSTPVPNGFDIVELDTIFLGDLVRSVQPPVWSQRPNVKFFDAGLEASTVDGNLYGVPHLLCGYFLFTTVPEVSEAMTATEFINALDAHSTSTLKVAMNFVGTNTTGSLYLDTWSTQYGPSGVQAAMTAALDPTVTGTMKALNDRCKSATGTFPCYDETFKNDPAQLLANYNDGTATAMIAYSEVLASVTRTTILTPAPLGAKKPAVLFTDALVMNRNCNATCQAAAAAFATYLTSAATYEWFLLGKDTAARQPRYLMPAATSAYTPSVVANFYYSGPILLMSELAGPFPNTGFIQARGNLKTNVLNAIKP